MFCFAPQLRRRRSLPAGAPGFAGSAHRRGVDWTTMSLIVCEASEGACQLDRAGVSRLPGVSLSDWGWNRHQPETVGAGRGLSPGVGKISINLYPQSVGTGCV